MSPREFEGLVQQAYWELPESLRDTLDNLDILIEDVPGPEAADTDDPLDHHHGDTLLGLYVGVPLVDRYAADPMMPDRIYIYRLPMLDICDTHDDVVREVRTTLLHEIGHYLGLSEHDLDRLGYA
jgi:predicted Zn-dependent protease with MMP-like domain